jgi:DNA-binding XRE family transcriptional regulator
MDQAGYKTIDALANDIEVSRQTVTMAINGATQPTLALTLAVANALGVPVEEIAERAPDLKFPKGKGRSSGQQRPSMTAPILVLSV